MSTIDNHLTNCLNPKFKNKIRNGVVLLLRGTAKKGGIKFNPDSTILTLKTAVTLISNYMALMLVYIKLA